MSSFVEFTTQNQIGTLTLNRVEKHNALNPQMIQDIYDVFIKVKDDPNIRVVMIQSKGKSFCAGADLNWMKESVDMSHEENLASAYQLYDMYRAVYTCPKPVIGKIHASAFGGGVGLIACMDVAVMMDGYELSLSELKLGLIPSTIAPFLLRKVGMKNLKFYGLSSKRISTAEAHQIGLVHHVAHTEDDLQQMVQDTIDGWLTLSPAAITKYKKMCEDVAYLSIDQAREVTSSEIADIRTTDEAQEGLKAFLEKRKPNWIK